MGSQVIGNLIAAFVLGHFRQVYFVTIMAVIALISVVTFFLLRKPLPHIPMNSTFTNSTREGNMARTNDPYDFSEI